MSRENKQNGRHFHLTTTHFRRIARIGLASLLITGLAGAVGAQETPTPPAQPAQPLDGAGNEVRNAGKPTIVLVHGAFADGSSWQHVIPGLERDGYTVIAVQMPLASFSGDVETTKRVIDAQTGPTVVVGHSYGGAVITEAAAGNTNVTALVYVAAFAPEVGEQIGAFGEKYPAPLNSALKPDAAGFLYIDRARFNQLFAPDVPATEARVMAATQKPVIGSVFTATVNQAAWKTVPSWYLVAKDDQAINPDLERFYAKRMGATTKEIKSSHVPFISHPKDVVRLIEQAASATAK